MYLMASMSSSIGLMACCGSPEWKSLPVALSCHAHIPAVPTQGCLSAESTQKTGPFLRWAIMPRLTSSSTPMPSMEEFSSLAIMTHATCTLSTGLLMAIWRKSSVSSATWPRQSVTPRPRSTSPSTVSLKGSKSQSSGFAGTTSMCEPTKETYLAVGLAQGYSMMRLLRPGVKDSLRILRGPPFSTLCGSKVASTWFAAKSSCGMRAGGLF
mmetsp:Transcript_31555/g.84443  ORF Transcript_31555/g.84443 Transcript_31555/m.84443 type:complete len:211 (-) Transcript_31555:73-705(-)